MDLIFRTATSDDATAVVPLIYSSGPAAFDFALVDATHPSAAEFLIRAFRRRGGVFGYANHTVATSDGLVVGAGACYTCAMSFPFMLAAIGPIIACYGIRAGLRVIRRGTQLDRQFSLPEDHKSYIAHLGVAPKWRNRGIGRQLLEHFLARSRQEGRTHAALDVSVENPRAQMLYERIGFEMTEERQSLIPSVPDHRRMEKSL